MTAAAAPADSRRVALADLLGPAARRNAWSLGLLAFLILLLVFTKLIEPRYGVTGIQGLAISVLPLALAAVAQAIVVISGGIDLSIGSIMALINVVSAVLMQGQSEQFGVAVVLGVLVLGLLIGAVNGGLVVVTRIPDIVVTLAMSSLMPVISGVRPTSPQLGASLPAHKPCSASCGSGHVGTAAGGSCIN